jgi:hypothetical protein
MYYWVVTSRADGRPHARAVWGLWLEPRFHFTTSPETVMARNVAATGYAAVHPESAVNVVIIEGNVRRTEGQALAEAGGAYEAKYGTKMDPDDPGMPFYSLEDETAIGSKAQDPRGSGPLDIRTLAAAASITPPDRVFRIRLQGLIERHAPTGSQLSPCSGGGGNTVRTTTL